MTGGSLVPGPFQPGDEIADLTDDPSVVGVVTGTDEATGWPLVSWSTQVYTPRAADPSQVLRVRAAQARFTVGDRVLHMKGGGMTEPGTVQARLRRWDGTVPVWFDRSGLIQQVPAARLVCIVPQPAGIRGDAVGVEDATEDAGLIVTTPEPVTGATQDPRVAELLDILEGFCDEDRIRWVILERLDRADAAAGIRRVTLDEAIERAAKQDYDDLRVMRYGLGHAWADAPERVKESARKRVRRTITAGFGGAS